MVPGLMAAGHPCAQLEVQLYNPPPPRASCDTRHNSRPDYVGRMSIFKLLKHRHHQYLWLGSNVSGTHSCTALPESHSFEALSSHLRTRLSSAVSATSRGFSEFVLESSVKTQRAYGSPASRAQSGQCLVVAL
eukprot:103952-Pleurochrysis_carterae.AAC.2